MGGLFFGVGTPFVVVFKGNQKVSTGASLNLDPTKRHTHMGVDQDSIWSHKKTCPMGKIILFVVPMVIPCKAPAATNPRARNRNPSWRFLAPSPHEVGHGRTSRPTPPDGPPDPGPRPRRLRWPQRCRPARRPRAPGLSSLCNCWGDPEKKCPSPIGIGFPGNG